MGDKEWIRLVWVKMKENDQIEMLLLANAKGNVTLGVVRTKVSNCGTRSSKVGERERETANRDINSQVRMWTTGHGPLPSHTKNLVCGGSVEAGLATCRLGLS